MKGIGKTADIAVICKKIIHCILYSTKRKATLSEIRERKKFLTFRFGLGYYGRVRIAAIGHILSIALVQILVRIRIMSIVVVTAETTEMRSMRRRRLVWVIDRITVGRLLL